MNNEPTPYERDEALNILANLDADGRREFAMVFARAIAWAAACIACATEPETYKRHHLHFDDPTIDLTSYPWEAVWTKRVSGDTETVITVEVTIGDIIDGPPVERLVAERIQREEDLARRIEAEKAAAILKKQERAKIREMIETSGYTIEQIREAMGFRGWP
jgi:hypothetical protein